MSTAPQVADDAKSAGYTHVETHGGLVPLDQWTPYGQRDGHDPVKFYLYIGQHNGQPFDQPGVHPLPHLLEPGERVPIVEMPGGQQPDPRLGHPRFEIDTHVFTFVPYLPRRRATPRL